jgi:hypothetical protein
LPQTVIKGHYRIDTDPLTVRQRDLPDRLNVVILVKTDRRSGKGPHLVLFSTDLALSAAHIVAYDRWRFPMEFNFRHAQQYWGWADFRTVSPTAVTPAANLAFLLVNLSAALLPTYRHQHPDCPVLDLKTLYRARRYLQETIQWLPQPPDPDLIPRLWHKLTAFGGIRSRPVDPFAA